MISTTIFGFITLFGHLLLLIGLFVFVLKHPIRLRIKNFCHNFGFLFAFLITLVAVVGSLYFQYVVGWEPCALCWYQRIFMYPLVVMLAVSIWKDDTSVVRYVVPLSVIGLFFALYQYYVQISALIFNTDSFFCATFGASDCAQLFMREFGYVTFPVLSATAFVYIILMLVLQKEN